MTDKTLATPRNMRTAHEHGTTAHNASKVRAYDPTTDSLAEVSLTPGDYFMLGSDEALRSSDGCEPLQLVTVETSALVRDALTGEIIAGEETVPVESVEWRIFDTASARHPESYYPSEERARAMFTTLAAAAGSRFELHSRPVGAWEVVA